MSSELSNFLLSSGFMLVMLILIAVRSFSAIRNKTGYISFMILVATTAAYIILNAVFIGFFLTYLGTEDTATHEAMIVPWSIIAFVFHIAYVLLPFAYHMFSRCFVKSAFGPIGNKIELIPLIILLVLILITPFTGTLYTISASNPYGHARGPLFMHFSIFNLFYYVYPLINLAFIAIRKKVKSEPYILQSLFVSAISLIGAIGNIFISFGDQFPFYPFCSVIGVMIAFFFIASKDSDMLKDKQQQIIQEALTKAEEASDIKTRFLSDMSHDIRTPMNAIVSLTDLALKESDINVMREYLSKIKISNNFLLGLINDILDMSRIESGDLVLHKDNLTRSEFLKTVETVISPLIKSKHIHYHPELNPGQYTILVDKLRMNQIFFNLLSNAVKYTPEGGDVWFEVHNMETENNKLRIKFVVRDNGVGMSEEFMKHLFEPFAREQSEYNLKTQGTGLGLSIVKGLVDKMGGTISVKSKLGEGSEFDVVFDVDIVANEELPIQAEQTDNLNDFKGLRVLLVEDNEINTFVAKTILEKVGCVVTTAENGKVAVEKFESSEQFSYDVIFMDIRMPVMNGIDATKAIRGLGRADGKIVPVIAMTADVFENERKNIFDAGITYYLSKPISADKIYDVLKECTITPPDRRTRRHNLHAE